MKKLTKEEFKVLWESKNGGGITFDDIANCAKDWGISENPRIKPIYTIANQVLVAAGCEKYFDETKWKDKTVD